MMERIARILAALATSLALTFISFLLVLWWAGPADPPFPYRVVGALVIVFGVMLSPMVYDAWWRKR